MVKLIAENSHYGSKRSENGDVCNNVFFFVADTHSRNNEKAKIQISFLNKKEMTTEQLCDEQKRHQHEIKWI